MLNIYALNAGGFYAIGTAVVAAPNLETATALANAASDKKYKLTYHGIVSGEPVGFVGGHEARVLNIHEWGMPHLPSKGSGVKVTF